MDIEIEDIAHGLARVARWNGQTLGDHPFSVAQHCIVVERILARRKPGLAPAWRLAALLHDAAEYVIGDMISPFKAALGYDYKSFEDRLQSAIHIRFGLPARAPEDIHELIKAADRSSAFLEATQLAGFEMAEARAFFGPSPRTPIPRLSPWPAVRAEAQYLERHRLLSHSIGASNPR